MTKFPGIWSLIYFIFDNKVSSYVSGKINIKLLDNIYEGDTFMRDVSKIFNIDIEDLDKQLYYDYDEYMKEVSYEQGEIDGALKRNKEIIKNMLDNNFNKETILKITNLDEESLNEILEEISNEGTKSDK